MVSGWRVRLRRPEARRPQEVSTRYRPKERPPPRTRKWFGWLVPILLVAGVPTFLWIKGHGVIDASGVVAGAVFPVGTPMEGRLATVFVSMGDPVKKDQEVARLSTKVLEANIRRREALVRAACARRDQLEEEWKRNERLARMGAGSASEALESKHAYESAKAEVEAAEAELQAEIENLQLAIIRAPVSGIVLWDPLQPGTIVDWDDPVMEILDDGDLWIEAFVEEGDRAYVHPGQRAEVRVEGLPGHVLKGRVARVFKGVKQRPRVLRTHDVPGAIYNPIKVVLDDPSLLKLYASFGMTTELKIYLD
jgi:multidrug resistance efflux pump